VRAWEAVTATRGGSDSLRSRLARRHADLLQDRRFPGPSSSLPPHGRPPTTPSSYTPVRTWYLVGPTPWWSGGAHELCCPVAEDSKSALSHFCSLSITRGAFDENTCTPASESIVPLLWTHGTPPCGKSRRRCSIMPPRPSCLKRGSSARGRGWVGFSRFLSTT